MDTSLISSEVVELLSQLTGQKLRQQDASPPVVFMTAVLAVLNGVIYADNTVAEQEKKKLEKTLNRLCTPGSQVHSLAEIISESFQQQKLCSIDNIITLTESLSESEKLLLLSLGYEMSAADGKMDSSEQKYLKRIANNLEIESQYQKALEAVLAFKEDINSDVLAEIRSLLDPSRFRELDTIFVFAAEQIFEQLPHLENHQTNDSFSQNNAHQQKYTASYQELEKFQAYRKNLESLCEQLFSILKDSNEQGFLTNTPFKNLEKVSQYLHSQQFRVAVIGDFSQGKSTLLNALLGEEIQPTRAIPCSGTVSLLRYGLQKRVICHYKDGTQEEILFDQYQEKVCIDKNLALESLREGLYKNQIKEIIFEHPYLELCKNGVTIIDSPGLNEHPDRTAVTQQMLEDIDAVIFLTDASRPLTQGERELIQELKPQLNGGNSDQPAANLFIVVNKWDLLRKEKDRQEVKERIENIVFGQPALIVGDNRIHYLSAQEALDTILDKTENEYLKAFQLFTQSLEKFLAKERGLLKIKQASTKINGLIEASLDELSQSKNLLEDKVALSEEERLKILEVIGEISGRDTKIKILADELQNEAIEEINESWNEWLEVLSNRLVDKAEEWSSEYSAIWSRDQLVSDYARQFNQNLLDEFNTWIENKLQKRILSRYLGELEKAIQEELKSIENNFNKYQETFGKTSTPNWVFYNDLQSAEEIGIMGNLAVPILAFIGIAAGGGLFGAGLGDMFDLDQKIRAKVFETGLEHFFESSATIEEINKMIEEAFLQKVTEVDEILSSAISMHEKNLKIAEKTLEKSQKQKEADQSLIAQKYKELQQIKNALQKL